MENRILKNTALGTKESILDNNMEQRNILYHTAITNINNWAFIQTITETKQFERYVMKCKKMINEFVWMVNTQNVDFNENGIPIWKKENQEYPLIPQTEFEETMYGFLMMVKETIKENKDKAVFFFDYYIGGMNRHLINIENLELINELIENQDAENNVVFHVMNESIRIALIRFLYIKQLSLGMSHSITANTLNTQHIPMTANDIVLIITNFVQETGQMLSYMYNSKKGLDIYMESHKEFINREIVKRTQQNDEDKKRINELESQLYELKREKDRQASIDKNTVNEQERILKENTDLRRQIDKLLKEKERIRKKYEFLKIQVENNPIEPINESMKEKKIDYNKKYLFICNIVSELPKRLKEKFPNSTTIEARKVSREIISNSDMVIMFVAYMAHKEYYEIMSMCKNTPFLRSSSVNIEKIEELLEKNIP